MKRITILANLLFIFNVLNGQTFSWAGNMGSTYMEAGNSIAVDSSGNVYTTGYFIGIADFDPGSATYNLTSNGTRDIFVSKLDAAGNFVWAEHFGSSGYDVGYGISTDATGNIYISGFFTGTVDFDPGLTVYNLTSAGGRDIFVCKLDAAGNFIWAKSMGGTSSEEAFNITLDANGNIYTTGYFQGTADFDPGAGTANLTSVIANDVFISKLDNSGNFVWAKSLGCTNYEQGMDIAIDANGNVYTTGRFNGTTDFDPGTGTYNLTASNYDIFISKLDVSGNFVWAKKIGSTGFDYGQGIRIDSSGNIILSGAFSGTVDFDPGASTFNLVSTGNLSAFFLKLNASGAFIWAKNITGTGSISNMSLALDLNGNIYTIGFYQGVIDFDPGSGIFNQTATGATNIYISKLDSLGNFVWATSIGNYSDNFGNDIAVDKYKSTYTTGYFSSTTDFDPGSTSYPLTTIGSIDIFVLKYSECGNMLVSTSQTDVNCYGDSSGSATATATGGYSPYSYVWSNGQSTQTATGLAAGTYTVTVNDVIGCITVSNVTITQANLLIADAGMDTNTCAGNSLSIGGNSTATGGTPGYSYLWTPGTGLNSTIVANPTATVNTSTSFIVTVTDSFGCTMSDTINIQVFPLPVVTLSQSSDTLLANTGFIQYDWYLNGMLDTTTNTGQLIITNQGNWQLVVTDSNGCSDSSNLITVSGIKQNLTQKMMFYPNPAHNQLYYNTGSSLATVDIMLYDLSGRMMAIYQKTTPKGILDISHIPQGMYLLMVRDENAMHTLALVIE